MAIVIRIGVFSMRTNVFFYFFRCYSSIIAQKLEINVCDPSGNATEKKMLNQEIKMRATSSYASHLFFAFWTVGIASAFYVIFRFHSFKLPQTEKNRREMLARYVRMWPNNGLPARIIQTVNTVNTMRRLGGSDWRREERPQR